ncbi:MAG: methyltransferase domain-containing protein [Planctomycetes bacterium]|nr:methyltransferase domain-containing protein [Planctomycetota bacterium]
MNLPKAVSFDTLELPEQNCPNCSSEGLLVFYRLDDIPFHSCLLMFNKDEALKYPKGNLQFGFCPSCGFITNTRFEPGVHNYSADYEETQGFSECFNAFAKSLAQRIIDKYDIRDKTILEIGCGKGEFLALMCRLGNNRGIGIDPAYVPERNPDVTGGKIEFIRDFYSEKYAHLKADVICCRHTLEHIAPTQQFMKTLRQTIGDRKDTLIFFELPDVMRVLGDGAFWDIYYEHCSYFTAGSLARLFRTCGFDIDDLYLDYDGQYLILTAYPAQSQTNMGLDIENDLEQLNTAIKEFKENCSRRIDYWRGIVEQATRQGQRVVIWGSGSKGVAFLTTLKLDNQIEYTVDINPYKQGRNMPGTGQQVISPKFLKQYAPDKIIVMNPIYCREIQEELDRLNIKADLLAVS